MTGMSANSADAESVGFVGLGNMGLPMAQRIAAKYRTVVHTRTPNKAEQLCKQGMLHSASAVATVADVVQACKTVMFCLPNDETSLQVIIDEALPHARAPKTLIDLSTVQQSTSLRCASACKACGVMFLDAPISGGPQRAENGTLTVMCGGEQSAFDQALSTLQCIGTNVRLLGPQGSGVAAKLVNQLLVGVHSMAACEAMLLADRLGIRDQQALQEVLTTSLGCSEVLKRHMPVIASSQFQNAHMPLRNIVKDLNIIQDAARQADLKLPATSAAQKVHSDAARDGYNDWDLAVIHVLLGRSEKDTLGPRLGISDQQWGF